MLKAALFIVPIIFAACSPLRQLRKAEEVFLRDTAVANAHVGISIYDDAEKKVLFNHNGDKYFTPASNTKLFTCYAAMKYLGDSLIGLRYYESPDTLYLVPAGDPSLLASDFKTNPVYDFLQKNQKPVVITDAFWQTQKWGKGWSWDDYLDDYMAERSPMPVYGNVATVELRRFDYETKLQKARTDLVQLYSFQSHPDIKAGVKYVEDSTAKAVSLHRSMEADSFTVTFPYKPLSWKKQVPFVTSGLNATVKLIGNDKWSIRYFQPTISAKQFTPLYSQPTDSLLKIMMHRSDNFFAEQMLLMVSNEQLGLMNERLIIDTLLKTALADLPQKPAWVDGSGLSRFNLFTPQDFIFLLQKIKSEFGLERIRNILPKGNTGTLANLYKQPGNSIFAKTGTLTGHVALSGYLVCKSGKLLIFSILVNNHNGTAKAVRAAIERYIKAIWDKY